VCKIKTRHLKINADTCLEEEPDESEEWDRFQEVPLRVGDFCLIHGSDQSSARAFCCPRPRSLLTILFLVLFLNKKDAITILVGRQGAWRHAGSASETPRATMIPSSDPVLSHAGRGAAAVYSSSPTDRDLMTTRVADLDPRAGSSPHHDCTVYKNM